LHAPIVFTGIGGERRRVHIEREQDGLRDREKIEKLTLVTYEN
jgi:hypothetical protein